MAPTWPDPIFDDDTAASSSSTVAAASSSSANSNTIPIPIDIIVLFDDEEEHPPPCRRRKSRSDDEGEHPPPSRRHKYEHWWFPDEVRILTELASHRRKYGMQPPSSQLLDALLSDKPLKRVNVSAEDVAKKVYALEKKFRKCMAAGGPGDNGRDRQLYELSMEVWRPDLLQI